MNKAGMICWLLLLAHPLLAQTHFEDWNKISVSKKINTTLTAQLDFNIRQQANYNTTSKNFFALPLMRSNRLWLMYAISKPHTIIGSLFYGTTYELLTPSTDLVVTKEIQLHLGYLNTASFKQTQLKTRILFENRTLVPEQIAIIHQLRYRWLEQFQIPLLVWSKNSGIYAILQNELLFKTQQSTTSLDQNRSSLAFLIRHQHIDYTVGFQKTFQNKNTQTLAKNQLIFSMQINL